MKKDPRIQNAIDESLSSVHFDARDMHRVLRAAREQEAPRVRARRKSLRLDLVFAAATVVLVIAPLSLFALRAQRMQPSDITAITAQGHPDVLATQSPSCDENLILASPAPAVRSGMLSENGAIAVARACFEAQCDTSIFTFEEYTVSVQDDLSYGSDPSERCYEVTMSSVYNNGCTFRVVLSAESGEVISFSTPRLATVPAHVDYASEEVRAWYEKYGEHIFTWPLDIQAEFSRRYEGGMLRTPREGEITEESILKRAPLFADSLSALPDGSIVGVYMMLYSERAFSDGQARYQIYCFPGGSIDDGLPERYLLVTMLACDGTIESSELLFTSDL